MILKFIVADILALLLMQSCLAKTTKPTVTLCSTTEKIVFSCSFKNGKTVSICASSDLSASTGILQYRFGRVGKRPELVFPSDNKILAKDQFWFYPNGYEHHSGDAIWLDPVRTLGFKHDGLIYELEVTANKGTAEYEADLSVKKGIERDAALVTSLSCPLTRAINHIYDLQELGLPLQPNQ